jgi:hypothetical protein
MWMLDNKKKSQGSLMFKMMAALGNEGIDKCKSDVSTRECAVISSAKPR